MKHLFVLSIVGGVTALGLVSGPVRAANQLSPERIDAVDKLGYFTPGFKAAVHDVVDSKQALQDAGEENHKLSLELPGLQKQATEVQAQTIALRQELAKYEHPEETDFVALQNRMKDDSAKLEDQIALAQAYVWTYPASPHEADAQQYLQQAQKKVADALQAAKDSESARAATYARTVQRAQAKDLTVEEWRDFLRNMSQDDLVKMIGRPTSQSDDYWTYGGEWIADPTTHKKVGIQINFSAGRVLNVDEIPPPP
jgi:regulator of replication initiation timing